LVPNYLIMPGKVDLTDLDMWARTVPYGSSGGGGGRHPSPGLPTRAPASGRWG